MRRALFTTGFPQECPVVATPTSDPESCLQILDLRSLNEEMQSYTRFVTLFAWPLSSVNSFVQVFVQVGSETPVPVGNMQSFQDVLTPTGPTSLTFSIRGNVRIFAASDTTAAAVFGFYEIETVQPVLEVPRPLQPSAPVSPFTVVPFIADDDSLSIHLFKKGYVDLISINFNVLLVPSSPGVQTVTFPNSVSLLLPEDTNNAQYNLMSGIPMLSTEDNQTIVAGSTLGSSKLVVTGNFSR